MDTLRVDICYRPLRIGWAIREGDFDAYRQAVKYSYALWGGRFNPILVVDHEDEAQRLVDMFRVDIIWPLGDNQEVRDFAGKFPHLINPFPHSPIFSKGSHGFRPSANVLDVHNALAHLQGKPELKAMKDKGVRLYTWQDNDPLADVFLSQFGAYPCIEETGFDYRSAVMTATEATENALSPTAPIPANTIEHPSISYISRHALERHHNLRAGWDFPGFFVGDISNLDDLVCHWNLRACDIPLWFVDPQHMARYSDLIPAWEKTMRDQVANYRHESDRQVAVWTRQENIDEACKAFGDSKLMRCHVSDVTWNGLNVKAPTMHFEQTSVLGVMGMENGKPRVSFALADKPFCGDTWFYQQHLVASISFIGGLYGDEQHTFDTPYLPELNEFYARTMHFSYNKLRVEPERIGLIIDAADHDSFLYALPVANLTERVFDMIGYNAKLSSAGLITRQLISKLGGLQGGRVFKIPGVRRLINTHGPTASFTKDCALQLIRSNDLPGARFSDHEDLHIERRAHGEKLQPDAVFGRLVEKGLFRIGAELTCPSCRMRTWTALDNLKQQVVCELCGHEHDATRQLTDSNKFYYRRSGVLGAEKNVQGAIPVVLTLQQLETSLHSTSKKNIYSPSLDLTPKTGAEPPKCEVDFVWIIPRPYPDKTVVILGECKDQGPIDANDIVNLKRVADLFPSKRFEVFVLLSQLAPFTADEIESAKTLNNECHRRVILLTARELEPYFIYERTKAELGVENYGSTPEDMAEVTAKIYFNQ